MIDGLKLDITADELVRLLDVRISEHTRNAAADDSAAEQSHKSIRPDDLDDEWEIEGPPGGRLRRRAQQARARAEALTFMRDHIIRGEIYRLSESDLRTLEILRGRGW